MRIRQLNLIVSFCIASILLANISSTFCQDYKIEPGAIFAVNMSQVENDNMRGYNKVGITAGMAMAFHFNAKWKLHTELLFSQKGSHEYFPPDFEYYDSSSIPGKWDYLKLHYMEIPLFASYKFSKKAEFNFGFSASRLLYFDYKNSPRGNYDNRYFRNRFTNELNLLLGVSYYLTPTISAIGRVTYSNAEIPVLGTGNFVIGAGLYYHILPVDF